MPITRTFTVDELERLGVTYTNPQLDEIIEMDDNRELHNLVFPHDGKHWEIYYRTGNDLGVWWDDDEVTATEVEQREVTVTKWLPVEAGAEL